MSDIKRQCGRTWLACRVVGVSESGYYELRGRAPSERAIRHAWSTDLIREVHAESRGTYGGRRVHAELTLGRGVLVGHGAVEMLMRQAGIVGAIGRPKWRRSPPEHRRRTRVHEPLALTGSRPETSSGLVSRRCWPGSARI